MTIPAAHARHIEDLGHVDPVERSYAAQDLGDLGTAAAVGPLLARLVVEPERQVQAAIIDALEQIGSPEALEGAVRLLASEEVFVRNQMVELLGRREEALPPLIAAMAGDDPDVRKLAFEAAARLEGAVAAGVFARALADADENVVITAIEQVGARRLAAFRGEVERVVLHGAEPMLITAALETLRELGDRAALDAVRRRFGQLEEAPELYQFSVLRLVGAVGGADELHYVAAMIGRPGGHLVAPAVDALIELHARTPLAALPPPLCAALIGALEADAGPLGAAHHGLLVLLHEFADDAAVGAALAGARPRVGDPRLREVLPAPVGTRPRSPPDHGGR
jgi:hypothetical protein